MTIYPNDLDFFLKSFSTDLDEISDIWREKGGFVSMPILAQAIIDRKPFSPRAKSLMTQLAGSSFPKDFRSGAFERQNFFYALADHYAKIADEPAALVEFDVGNCNGTGDYAGDEAVLNVIRFMRTKFEEVMTRHGATFVESYDNAKNDDLKLIVTGLDSAQLADALSDAQSEILKTFIVAHDIPHTKYTDGDRDGIGVGSGFVNLGRGRSPQELQERLNVFVETRKLEDSEARREIREKVDTSLMKSKFVRGMLSTMFDEAGCNQVDPDKEFPFDLSAAKDEPNPFDARRKVCDGLAREAGMSDVERKAFEGIVDFYHSSEGLTGAQKSPFLFDDMRWVRDSSGDPVTILNIKVENCAGMNKVLSHVHSAEMTRHFAEVLSDFTERNFGEECADLCYYTGRNTFNLIIPGYDPVTVERLFRHYFQQDVDSNINERFCGEYFAARGLNVSSEMEDFKIGDIENLRNTKMEPGVLAININAMDSREFASQEEIVDFQNKCLSSKRVGIHSSPIVLPGGLTYQAIAEGKTAEELLGVMQSMASELVKMENGEDGAVQTTPAIAGHFTQPKR